MSKPKRVRVREKSKTCQYEKDRRNRINEHFNKLWEILPVYDASKPLSKIEILTEAVNTIKDLTEKVEKLLLKPCEGKSADVPNDVLKKLQDRVKKLLLRNEQLAGLLKNAGIKVPAECGAVKKVKKAPKYANNISPEQAKEFQKELEKENQGKRKKAPKTPKKRPNQKGKSAKTTFLPPQNCLVLVSQPSINNSCILLANPAAARGNQTVLTNSLLVKTPIASTSVKPSIFPTLLVANGPVMPLIPTPKPFIVVSTTSSKTPIKNSKKTLRPLKKKPITLTTHMNKVPIPALSSVYSCVKSKKVKVSDKKKSDKNNSAKVVEEKHETTRRDVTKNKEVVEEPVKEPSNVVTTEAKEVNFEEQYSSTCLKQAPKSSFELDMNLPATELSNDIFASLQGCHNPESTSPTAAFLLAFPLVSSGVKVTDVIGEENTESHPETPNLLQIGTMDGLTKPTQSYVDNLTPNLLNFDSFSFFKDYNNVKVNSSKYDLPKAPLSQEFYKPPETNFQKTTNQFVSNMYYPPVYTSATSNSYSANYMDNSKSYSDCLQKEKSKKSSTSTQIKPVNWMTTPSTTTYKPDYFIPPYTKETNFNQNSSYFNSSYSEVPLPNYNLYQQRPEEREERDQFSWTNTYVPATLPTLVGDLALNNPPYIEKNVTCKRKSCDNNSSEGPNPSTFLSVSQLVDKYQENAPKVAPARRNPTKAKKGKSSTPEKSNYNISVASNLFDKKQVKNLASSYSAEALIGNQENHNKRSNFQNNNMMPYYPPPPPPPHIEEGTNYFQTSNFMPNSTSYIQQTNNLYPDPVLSTNSDNLLFQKPAKKMKKLRDPAMLPSFDLHFLSTPAAVNSPILPDDFHTGYLPPTTLYSCKNPLYPKREEATGGPTGGTSLTNFNLSTIFPEINKGSSDLNLFPQNSKKNYPQPPSGSKTFSVASQLQVPYSNKPIF
ncbi:uncharacterized protein LOC126746072 [Anthonomus grandis grandis]|uniref:uncharacterized protein LOC126746072 n=1 Tax=Anthonomus grandis grandis TaxID=2921223 RepID=UPI002165C61F|nr:uncharacterized protein LOC126746072 [Anthonomus grandis grandis]